MTKTKPKFYRKTPSHVYHCDGISWVPKCVVNPSPSALPPAASKPSHLCKLYSFSLLWWMFHDPCTCNTPHFSTSHLSLSSLLQVVACRDFNDAKFSVAFHATSNLASFMPSKPLSCGCDCKFCLKTWGVACSLWSTLYPFCVLIEGK